MITVQNFSFELRNQIASLELAANTKEANASVVVPAYVCALWGAMAAQNGHAWADALAEAGTADWPESEDSDFGITEATHVALWRQATRPIMAGIVSHFEEGFSALQMANWALPRLSPGPCGWGIIAPTPSSDKWCVWRHTTTSGRQEWEVIPPTGRSRHWALRVYVKGSARQSASARIEWDNEGVVRDVSFDDNLDRESSPSEGFLCNWVNVKTLFEAWAAPVVA